MEWISVKDRLPGVSDVVLIWYNGYIDGNAAVAGLDDGKWYLFHTSTKWEQVDPPNYWMPLPEPPKTN